MMRWECWVGGPNEEDPDPHEDRMPDVSVQSNTSIGAARTAMELSTYDFPTWDENRLVHVRLLGSHDAPIAFEVTTACEVVYEAKRA